MEMEDGLVEEFEEESELLDESELEDDGREKAESSKVIKPKTTNTRILELWPGISDPMIDFGGLPIPQRLADALTERGIVTPSPIQHLAMPKLAKGDHVIIHAPTGGGKTLSYLLPMLARLQPTMHVGVQALVFVPTPELALQVGRELKWLFYVLSGGADAMCWFNPQVPQEIACQVLLSRSNLWDAVRQDAAVMVCTPGLILSELRMLKWEARRFKETLALFMASNVNCIICDEVDALTPAQKQRGPTRLGAAEHVSGFVLDVVRSRYRNRPVQLIASSATSNSQKVSEFLDRLMEKKYPKRRDVGRRATPELVQDASQVPRVGARPGGVRKPNRAVSMPQCIQHCLALVEDKDDGILVGLPRFDAMVNIIKHLKGDGNVLVFVPERVKLDAVVMMLQKRGIPEVSKYRSEVGLGPTTEQLMDNKFLRKPRRNDSWRGRPAEQSINPLMALQQYQEFVDDVNKEDCRRVLVAKMGDGRGIDLPNVDYVVLLEGASSPGDYLHLSGRTGRMGQSGTAITICTDVERWNLLDTVEMRLGIIFDLWDMENGRCQPREEETIAAVTDAKEEITETETESTEAVTDEQQ